MCVRWRSSRGPRRSRAHCRPTAAAACSSFERDRLLMSRTHHNHGWRVRTSNVRQRRRQSAILAARLALRRSGVPSVTCRRREGYCAAHPSDVASFLARSSGRGAVRCVRSSTFGNGYRVELCASHTAYFPRLIFCSVKRTCCRTIGSYFESTSLSGVFFWFFVVV